MNSKSDRVMALGFIVLVSAVAIVGISHIPPQTLPSQISKSVEPSPRTAVAQDDKGKLSEPKTANDNGATTNSTTTIPAVNSEVENPNSNCKNNAAPKKPNWRSLDWWIDSPVTIFNALLFVATGALAIYTRNLWAIAAAQTTLARNEFNSTHRPKIIIRDIHFQAGFDVDDDPTVYFIYINTGDNIAKNITIDAGIICKIPGLPIKRDSPIRPTNPSKTILTVGEFGVGVASSGGSLERYVYDNIILGKYVICCIGTVMYYDNLNILRRTGFARVYDPNTDRFTVIDDPEREYAY